jgi:hypothetical protein
MPDEADSEIIYLFVVEPNTQITKFLIHLNLILRLYPFLCIDTTTPFCCGTKDSDYSISDSPEPDLITVSISNSLHIYYMTCMVLLSTWPKFVSMLT